jgi:hypothetical protein
MTLRILALVALSVLCLGAAEDGAKPGRKPRINVEHQALLAAFDTDKDGKLSDAERDAAIAAHREAIGKQIKDPKRLEGEEGKKLMMRLIGGKLANQAWFKALGDKTQREQKSEADILEVQTSHSLPVGAGFRAYVKVRWGDLDDKIKGGGKEYYSNWDGKLTIKEGTTKVTKKLAFDDGKGAEPKVGSGADKLDDAGGDTTVSWRAAVVGWTDGLIIQLDLPHPAGEGTVEAGGKTIHFTITPAANGCDLPDGRKVGVSMSVN